MKKKTTAMVGTNIRCGHEVQKKAHYVSNTTSLSKSFKLTFMSN